MARPDAPPELGLALSQARAVRVRSHLLDLLSELSSCPRWQEEEAMDCGVRAVEKSGRSRDGGLVTMENGDGKWDGKVLDGEIGWELYGKMNGKGRWKMGMSSTVL